MTMLATNIKLVFCFSFVRVKIKNANVRNDIVFQNRTYIFNIKNTDNICVN